MKKVSSELSEVSLDFLIKYEQTALVWSVFDRSQTNLRRTCIDLSYKKGVVDGQSYFMGITKNGHFPDRYIETFTSGRDLIASGLVINSHLNKEFIITTKEKIENDVYSLLMNVYDLPILEEWVDYIIQESIQRKMMSFENEPVVYSDEHAVIDFGYGKLKPEEIIVIRIFLTEEYLKNIISAGLKRGDIYITKNKVVPLNFNTLDEYYARYGANIVSNLTHLIEPLSEVNGLAKNVATSSKRLFPAQGNGINGLVERLKRANYAILNMDMGTGKTLQALAAMDAYFNTLAIEKTGKALKDVMLDGDVSYKAAVICPGHLVDKWCSEAGEIYGMQAKKIKSLKEIVDINNDRDRYSTGKWLFVFSKDFAKLSDMQGPIPSKYLNRKELKLQYCADCFREKKIYVYRQFGQVKCPECESRNYKKYVATRKAKGLICPDCGELLLKNISDVSGYKVPDALTYDDFRTKKTSNLKCYHCGASLWGSQVSNINATHKPNWVRVSYYGNKSHKSKNSCWVHRSQLASFGIDNKLDEDEYSLNRSSTGYRRYSPARYIERHMKKFFDFLIADECHLYESGTAQSQAFSSLVNASKKTLALTGTLTNGYARGLFYMFWRLDPKKMVDEGYTYSSEGESLWNNKYGVLEARIKKTDDNTYNATSYGKSMGNFKLKPGVSPQISRDFLLESAVQLQISELSEGLPQLNETIVPVETENIILQNLRLITTQLDVFARSYECPAINMVKLQFQLFYADHPYNIPAVKNPLEKGGIVLDMKDYDCSNLIADGKLLNKEKKLLEIVESELAEKRRCYIFVESTGRDGDFFILDRIKEIVSRINGVKPLIMEANTVSASGREKWLRKQIEENDYNVIISNPRLVETGIDFIWNKNGVEYNIPTIIFYQVGYRLDTLWQASRRHYRLTQKSDCRTYYLEAENTMQLDVLSLMAEKQVAVSAIQGGEFSSRGLASMAKGIDPKIELARRLKEGRHASVEEVEKMFKTITLSGSKEWHGVRNNLISDILGEAAVEKTKKIVTKENNVSKRTIISVPSFDDWSISEDLKALFKEPEEKKVRKKQNKNQISFLDLFK